MEQKQGIHRGLVPGLGQAPQGRCETVEPERIAVDHIEGFVTEQRQRIAHAPPPVSNRSGSGE